MNFTNDTIIDLILGYKAHKNNDCDTQLTINIEHLISLFEKRDILDLGSIRVNLYTSINDFHKLKVQANILKYS